MQPWLIIVGGAVVVLVCYWAHKLTSYEDQDD